MSLDWSISLTQKKEDQIPGYGQMLSFLLHFFILQANPNLETGH